MDHASETTEEPASRWRSQNLEAPSPKELMSGSSASLEMDWEKFAASVDVLEGCRATTMPADNCRPVLNSICTGNTARSLPQNIAVKAGSSDPFIVNLAEYRKGYHYTVEVPQPVHDQENLTPRRVLDQQGSNDFAAYLQETGGTPKASPDLYMASSPFAAHTRQPFDDRASCRSRLSDYGYDTHSEDGEGEDYGEYGDEEGCMSQEEGEWLDAQGTKRSAEPFEDCGFWAEVGASGSQKSPADSQGTSSQTHFQFVAANPVEWEVNEWDSASERSKRHCAPSSARKQLFPCLAAGNAPSGVAFPGAPDQAPLDRLRAPGPPPAVLLPWDME